MHFEGTFAPSAPVRDVDGGRAYCPVAGSPGPAGMLHVLIMGYFSRRGWLLPAAAGLLVASGQPKLSSGLAAAGVPTAAGSTDTASVAAPADGITASLL